MRRRGWALPLLLWLVLAAYLLWPPHRIAWWEGATCLVTSLRGRLCARWR